MQTRKSNAATAALPKTGTKKISAGPADKKMKNGKNLFHELFIDELKDIYWAEKHLVKNLPKIVRAATTTELKDAVTNHLRETEEQVKKIERVFELLGEKAQAKKCDAMAGLVEEASSIIEDTEKGTYTRDAALITAAQKVEHYEIASYGALTAFAKTMGHNDAAAILAGILEEEKNTDIGLNELAKKSINQMAMNEGNEASEESE